MSKFLFISVGLVIYCVYLFCCAVRSERCSKDRKGHREKRASGQGHAE